MINTAFSFIIHTTNPISDNKNEVYIELAIGQGETLASANQQGTPYRLVYNKSTKACDIISFSSYSFGLFASDTSLVKKRIDYSTITFTKEHELLVFLGAKLGEIAIKIEQGFGNQPQDIEGCVD